MNKKLPILFSGIQPSGNLMLGNYLGALKQWTQLQEKFFCFFCIVDLHAITFKQEPKELKRRSYEILATYLACGIDPKKNIIFLQSQVPQHAELSWILNCSTYMGELSRMTQFKDKSEKQKNIGVGIFTYPILMAADILLYQTNLVPVGQDQKQHLELTRDLALRFNNLHGDIFKIPEPYIPPVGAKIMSLVNPTQKMSKSDENLNATIFLMDTDDQIQKKFKRAVTDSGSEILYTDDKPGVKNLISIQAALTNQKPEDIVTQYQGKQYGHLKLETAEIVIEALKPFRSQFISLTKDQAYLDKILKDGAATAQSYAEKTLNLVKEALGFII